MLDVCVFFVVDNPVRGLFKLIPFRTNIPEAHYVKFGFFFFVFSYPMNISLPNTKSQRFIKISEGLLRSKHCRCLFVGKRGKIKGLYIATL